MNGIQNGARQPPVLTYEDVERTANYLKEQTNLSPKIGIICGSGLGPLADCIQDPIVFAYKDLPNFPVSTVSGHAGKLVFGSLRGKTVMCMKGRVHGYEGQSMWKITFPIRVMKLMGVETMIATNAAGGLNPDYEVGDVMLMKDHINLPGLCGLNPLIGKNEDRFGERFTAMSNAYDSDLRQLAKKLSIELGFNFVREGVYSVQVGPCFESVAECRMLRNMGADVTGMSTVPEVIVARHCGIRCFALSLVTNKCVIEYDSDKKANHQEVLETGEARGKEVQLLIAELVENMENE